MKTRKYHHEFALDNVAIHSENYLLEVVLFHLVDDVKSFIPFLFSGSLMLKLREACYDSCSPRHDVHILHGNSLQSPPAPDRVALNVAVLGCMLEML